jgi:pilus assembly protein FimV
MAIHPDSDPKSASPRSRAPKGELEQYGVWVKAEPQDVIEEVAAPAAGDLDFELPGDSASLPEESFLSEDEERLLGSFDSEFEAPSASLEESGLLPDIEDMPPLEESLLSSEPSEAEIGEFESASIDISLDDIPSSHEPSPIHPGAHLDMDSIQGLSDGIEDVSSEFLDTAPEGKSEGGSAGAPAPEFGTELDDVTSEFLDSTEPFSPPKEGGSDFEPLDIDLHFDDSAASLPGEAGPPSSEGGFEAVTEFDDFLSIDESKPQAEEPVEAFDDISAVERELSAPLPEAAASPEPPAPIFPEGAAPSSAAPSGAAPSGAAPAAGSAREDLSTALLQKIAEELSSIRGELVSLKSRIGEILVSGEGPAARPSEPAAEASVEAAPSGGFFDDEEDETIALTGDELDNILNTADFTEETPEVEEPLELETEALPPEMPFAEKPDLLDETLLPESGDYSSADLAQMAPGSGVESPSEPAIEEVRLGEADSVDAVVEEPLVPEAVDLSLFAEEGAVPMTPAPEDTSFLEAPEPLDIGLPLGDEPLVEPDLSDFDLETEDFEPHLEISEELPLASLEPEIEDVTLGIEAGPDYSVDDSVVEAELLEPIPEIEETSFADINLHEEDQGFDSSEATEVEELDFLPDSDLGSGPAPEVPSAESEELTSLEEEEDLVLAAEEEAIPEALSEAPAVEEAPPERVPQPSPRKPAEPAMADNGDRLKSEIKSVLSYLDKLLDSLPEEKIEEFARSEYFDTYKKLFEELGLV